MSTQYIRYGAGGAPNWRGPVATSASLPASNNNLGDAIAAEDTGIIYVWTGSSWTASGGGGGGGVDTVGSFSASSKTNGASISGTTITFGPADGTNPGMIKASGAQTIGATLTITNAPTLSALTASKPVFTDGSKVLTSSGTVPIANGGTNSAASLNNNRVMQSTGGAIVEAAAITASRALISDANGIPTHSTVTSTTLAFLDATSSVQTQLNAKAPTSAPTFTTSITFGNYRVDPSFHDFGNSGSAITLDLSQASCVKTTFNNATPAITITNGQAGAAYRLMFAQDGSGSRIPSFVTSINWGTLGAPTFSTGASKIDFVDIWTPDGSTWYGMAYALGY